VVATTALRRSRTVRRSPVGCRTRNFALSEGGHAFFVRDRAALPEILDFLAG